MLSNGIVEKMVDFSRYIEIIEEFLQGLSNRDYIRFDERYIKLIMILIINITKIYYIRSEQEIGQGYADIYLQERPPIQVKYEHIIEIKYIKKEEYSEEKLKEKIKEGTDQVKRYLEKERAQSRRELKGHLLIFSGAECKKYMDLSKDIAWNGGEW